VDVAHGPEGPLLPRLDAARDPAAEPAVERRERAHELLLEQRRKEELPVEEHAEARVVLAHEAMEERRAAPRVADDEDRCADGNLPEAGEEDRVEEEADRVHGRDERHRHEEAHEELPARARVRLTPGEADHATPRREVEVHAHVGRGL
jgi:hypothetical protein